MAKTALISRLSETLLMRPTEESVVKQSKDSGVVESGTLYVVATPIGNLDDITARALSILKAVGLIAAEGADHTRQLCAHYGISAKITSLNQHNQKTKSEQLLRILRHGRDIALVTNAGTPGISDPGSYLADAVLKAGLRLSPAPGPSAIISALSVSGLPAEQFVFAGFLPNRSGKRRQQLKDMAEEARTMIFLEAPHRVEVMLKDVLEILGDRTLTIAREMTKIFEEIKRGTVLSVLKDLSAEAPRGEYTIVLEGNRKPDGQSMDDTKLGRILELVFERPHKGMREIALRISEITDIPFRKVYKECLARGKPAWGEEGNGSHKESDSQQ